MARNRSSHKSINQPSKNIQTVEIPSSPKNRQRGNNVPGTRYHSLYRVLETLNTFRTSTTAVLVFSYAYTSKHHNRTYFYCGCSCAEHMFNPSCFGGRNVHIQLPQVLQSERKTFHTTCMGPISTHTHNHDSYLACHHSFP